jgi:multidrug efflux system membrane fusion protein
MTTSTSSTEPKARPEEQGLGLSGPYGPQHPHPRESSKRRGFIWLLALLIIAGVAGYAVWRAGHPAPAPQNAVNGPRRGPGGGPGRVGAIGPVPVVVALASRASVPLYLNGLGNVTAFYTVTVKSRVDGQMMKADFNEGDLVKEGQVLFEIDPRPFQVQLEMTQGALAHDEAVLNEARIDLERYKAAFAKNAIAKQQMDDQEQIVAQDEGTVKQDIASVDNAKLQLIYAKVTAPITGVLGLRLVDPGNIVHAADTTGMIVITQLQPIAVLFTIPEDNLPEVTQKLRAGVHLSVDAYNRDNSKKLASGKLLTLDNQIDNTTGTSKLKAVFDNRDNTLFPQQFVNIRLLVETLTDQLVVPSVAVQSGQQGNFVYLVDDRSRVHLQPVQVGITTDTTADVAGGLKDGDRVVVDGADRLVDGSPVRVRKPGEDSAAGAGAGRGGRSGRGGSRRGADGSPASGPGAADSQGAAGQHQGVAGGAGSSKGGAQLGSGSDASTAGGAGSPGGNGQFRTGNGKPNGGGAGQAQRGDHGSNNGSKGGGSDASGQHRRRNGNPGNTQDGSSPQ